MKYTSSLSLAVLALIGQSEALKLQQSVLRQMSADDFAETGESI